ncbi:MAG: hypothetical protein ACI395_00685 [Candidatus Cryptobacteroides sp.]
MKKSIITILLIVAAASGAGAQSMYDALNFSEYRYYGTARTMSMGNAFTALGGDPGSIGINPAGSAVARYSQVTVTPGVSFSVSTSQGADKGKWGFETAMRNTSSAMTVPNVGVMLNFDTHRERGVKNVSIGFVANTTNLYRRGIFAKGTNYNTSFSGFLAESATGIDPSLLSSSAYTQSIDWNTIVSYLGGGIADLQTPGEFIYAGVADNVFYTTDSEGNITHTDIRMGGEISQSYGNNTTGYRDDYLINVGMNISDYVFLGVNIGITSLKYRNEWFINESAQDPSLFQTGFTTMKYNTSYRADGTGVYGKFGVIVTPVAGLRIGAAIQTPTSTVIKEVWGAEISTKFTDIQYNSSAQTPQGEYSYRLLSPFRFNAGLAWTFGSKALISADYELSDYSRMFFKERNTSDNSAFDAANGDIRNYMGLSHQFRLGAEFKPISQLAVRAGYGLVTSPQKVYNDFRAEYVKEMEHTFSAGIGYSTKGSFYIDAAFMAQKYPDTSIMPYANYISGLDSPEILTRNVLYTVAVTLGFRF